VPKLPKKVHSDDGLADGPNEGGQAGSAEEIGEEVMRVRVYAIQDNGNMRQKFADHVEGTPNSTQHELDARVSLFFYRYRNGGLGNEYTPKVVDNGDGAYFDAISELEDEHGYKHLRADDQDISHGDDRAPGKWIMKATMSKRDTQKWIDCSDQNDDFGGTGNMMINKATSVNFIKFGIFDSIHPLKEKELEHIKADEEKHT